MTMIVINIHEAKAKLSEYVDAAARGERVVICRRNRPVAELRASPAGRREPRPIGLDQGRLNVPPSFFEPLPDGVLSDWQGDTAEPDGTPHRSAGESRRSRRMGRRRRQS